jgi:hypothetical protein
MVFPAVLRHTNAEKSRETTGNPNGLSGWGSGGNRGEHSPDSDYLDSISFIFIEDGNIDCSDNILCTITVNLWMMRSGTSGE